MSKTKSMFCKSFCVLSAITFCMFLTFVAYGQTKLSGKIVDATTKESIAGVTIAAKGKKIIAISGTDGSFSIKVDKTAVLEISAVGYLSITVDASSNLKAIELISSETTLKEVIVTNNMAIDRKTPIAVSTIKSLQIEEFSANREFPELLETTPSVYVTKQGGGMGDSRISIRGFSQENVAVMVNGVPVNDMENGRVFWSNWSGLSEIGGHIQVQRGLGASKLSIAAVGGNINVVTKATEMRPGVTIFSSLGNSGFIKSGLGYSTGKTKSGFALSALLSRTSSAGYVDGTSSQVINYFVTAAWEINKRNSITATLTGAPQWHNQRAGTGRTYQSYYGNPNDPTVVAHGDRYNNSWGYYHGNEFNIYKNFYHKPVANINFYSKLNNKSDLSVVLYGSLGRGGGTAPIGSINGSSILNLSRDANSLIRFDDIEKWNTGVPVTGFGSPNASKPFALAGPYQGQFVTSYSNGFIKSAAMNEHNWYGTIINLTNKTTKNLTVDAGIDLRYYRGLHYVKLDDAIGSVAYFDTLDINEPHKFIAANDKKTKFSYNNDDIVKQYGGYLSLTYEKDKLTAFFAGTASNTSYQRIDYFKYKADDSLRKSAILNFRGFITKGGLSYRINQHHFVFGNVGYFEKPPLFSAVFASNNNKTVINSLPNQKIFGQEVGYNYRSPFISVVVNLYHTKWTDQTIVKTFTAADGSIGYTNILGLIEEHKGVELEAVSRPTRKSEITFMSSIGDWRYKNNVDAYIYDANNILTSTTPTHVYLKDVKVGNAAQTTAGIGASYEFFRGFRLRANYRYNENLYASFLPTDRSAIADSGRQAWKLPTYGLMNIAATYTFKIDDKRITLRANVDNLFDKHYLAEATKDVVQDKSNPKDFAIGDKGSGVLNTVNPGFGRTWVVSVKVTF